MKTRYSIIFGGIAGGLPAIAGRTAATGNVDCISILLGFFVFCWIPLHILTLAMLPKNLEGYKRAGVPMWPVVTSVNSTIKVINVSSILSATSIILVGFFLEIHYLSFVSLLIVSTYIIFLTLKNTANPSEKLTFKIFKMASIYMILAFLLLFIGIIMKL